MERIKRSWALVKASVEVLKLDKELLIFPLISSIMMIFITLTFLIPTLVGNVLDTIFDTGMPAFGYMVLFLFYLVQYTVVFYNNTALVGAAMIRLRGGDPTVRDGYKIASQRILPILGWSLISATVGLILNMLSGNSDHKRRGLRGLIASILGAAWNVLTFLVVPVLAVEGLGPIKAIQRSWELLKRSWGEQISGTLSIGLIFALIGIAGGMLMIDIGVALSLWLKSSIPIIIFGVLLLLFIMIISLLSSTLSGIFSAAVYAYAADGQVSLFDESLIRDAINP
ncbi:MAG: hypothetical protein BWX85_00358 [Chloroflexi bacterium ADurb.Bin120]|jgi:hypothetical protein|uniref:Glycerophosphoryl diester phosphodiesterase membrane domain-containing protein n=1 Tax=Candidatus Brevifilum fermentans TaxID=1986204 RepID=A0A1Y6K1J0_9CHLR|nr:DUF6159 family protein [Brevefilum fermentans]MDI9565313.1 DUF6159 family protein [Chloroflexota bacterium]OQB87316.1 MAG: hypothetical protein BWX85_00358 [Chloroflexi bacterium ADurb.Bin120]SMX53514.1 conserved membrane protein of unknown function [Brevefilum fermentans]